MLASQPSITQPVPPPCVSIRSSAVHAVYVRKCRISRDKQRPLRGQRGQLREEGGREGDACVICACVCVRGVENRGGAGRGGGGGGEHTERIIVTNNNNTTVKKRKKEREREGQMRECKPHLCSAHHVASALASRPSPRSGEAASLSFSYSTGCTRMATRWSAFLLVTACSVVLKID